MGLKVSDTARFGTLHVAPDWTLQSFAEKQIGSGLINAGVCWFSPECIEKFPARRPLSFELDVFPILLSKKVQIGVVSVSAPFIDIGTPASLIEAEAFVEKWIKKTV